MRQSKKVLYGALVGCGNISRTQLEAWGHIENAKIIALVDHDIKKAISRADQFNVSKRNIFKSLEELSRDQEIDFLDIATPPSAHLHQVQFALERNIPVLCQKPFANTISEAKAMLELSRNRGVILSINENWRWRSWYQMIKEYVSSGAIGKPHYFSIRSHKNLTLATTRKEIPDIFIQQPYTRTMKRLIVFEFGIHLIDVARFLFGEMESVSAGIQKISDLCEGEDNALILLKSPSIMGLIDLSWCSIKSDPDSILEDVIIDGLEGRIELSSKSRLLTIKTLNRTKIIDLKDQCGPGAYLDSFINAQQHFVDCVIAGKNPQTHAGDNIKTLKLVFDIYQLAESEYIIRK